MNELGSLAAFTPVRRVSAADQVFEQLYRQIITLELEPGARVSETEIARRTGLSRQPVRDAFYRLAQLGFLVIRPQRATTVSPISPRAVLQARFLRAALEVETVRIAAERLGPDDFALLDAQMSEQAAAVAAGERERFHALDDAFHRMICELAGLEFTWTLIRENKAHMDRVRFLSLAFGARTAFEDHRRILAALKSGDGTAAASWMRTHLGRIEDILSQIRDAHRPYFAEEET